MLRAYGFGFALDDFGTAHSGLGRLLQFDQFSSIKLDKLLTRGLISDRRSQVIVAGILSIASELGLPVVAEGVEDELTYWQLKHMGCDYAQGYLFGGRCSGEELLSGLCTASFSERKLG
jgi:diguanylate cyclase